jgi:hypothetical protein
MTRIQGRVTSDRMKWSGRGRSQTGSRSVCQVCVKLVDCSESGQTSPKSRHRRRSPPIPPRDEPLEGRSLAASPRQRTGRACRHAPPLAAAFRALGSALPAARRLRRNSGFFNEAGERNRKLQGGTPPRGNRASESPRGPESKSDALTPLDKTRKALEKKAAAGDVYAARELREHADWYYGSAHGDAWQELLTEDELDTVLKILGEARSRASAAVPSPNPGHAGDGGTPAK